MTSPSYLYVSAADISEDLFCPICTDVFVQPHESANCHHPFCLQCILSSLGRTRQCPMCRDRLRESDLIPSTQLEARLDELFVRCCYAPCAWKGRRGAFLSHVEEECEVVLIPCAKNPNHADCPESFIRAQLDQHREKECTFRLYPCADCLDRFSTPESLTAHLANNCPFRQITCEKCQESFQARDESLHKDRYCPFTLVPCPHRQALGKTVGGCKHQFPRSQLLDHLKRCQFEPLREPLAALKHHLQGLEGKMEFLMLGVRAELDQLTTLRLSALELEDLAMLKSILRFNPALKTIQISDFQPGAKWSQFVDLVLSNPSAPLTGLNLQGSKIERAGAVLLAKSIRVNPTLRRIWLNDNMVGDQGVEFLSKALEQTRGLELLDLTGCNITDRGVEFITRALKKCPSLLLLNLSGNLLRSRALRHLSSALIDPACRLEHLDLGRNDISSNGLQSFAESLSKNSTLSFLSLAQNKLHAVGLEDLTKALVQNTALKSLNLSCNQIDDQGALCLLDLLAVNKTLTLVDVEENPISISRIEAIRKILSPPSPSPLL